MSNRYSIGSEKRGAIEIFSLYEEDLARAVIAPGWGNNCLAFRTRESILEPAPYEESSQRPSSYGSPILFPFPNRIRGGEFCFLGQRYVVSPSRHGFVREKPWAVVAVGASDQEGAWIKSAFEATQYPEILKQFPFPFHLEVTYRLKDCRLEMGTIIQNIGWRDMPCGLGIHPYFRRPKQGTIQVPALKRWELSDGLPTGKLLEVEGPYDLHRPRELTNLVLDDIFTDLIADSDGIVRCVLNDQIKCIRNVVEFDVKQFPNVVVYTPPPPRQAICIEPYTCITDAFNLHHRMGVDSNLIVLRPGETINFKVCVYAHSDGAKP